MATLKNKFKVILIFLIAFLAFILFLYLKKQQPKPVDIAPPKNNLSNQQPMTNSFQIEKQSEYSFSFLKNNAGILSEIRKIKNDFKIEDIGTSLPLANGTLENGKKYLLISGCQPHNCGGTQIIIAYDEEDKKVYLLVENFNTKEGYDILDNPPEEIRKLLIYYYLNG